MKIAFYIFWVLQIILESLPISSSGHLALIAALFDKSFFCFIQDENINHLMHIPTAIILSIFIISHWGGLLIDFYSNLYFILKLFLCIMLSDFITGIIYLIFNFLKLRISSFLPIGFLITALLLLSLYFLKPSNLSDINFKQAVILGLVQGIALMPGISRLGATFVAGCWLGLAPEFGFVYSCAIQLPLILVAVFKCFYNRSYEIFKINNKQIIILIIASVFSYFVLKYISHLTSCLKIKYLGWYMIIPVLIAFLN